MNIEQIKHRIGNIAIMCDENDKEQLDILAELLALINDINIESIETVKDVPSAEKTANKININEYVKVKLTDYGKEIFYHQYDDLNKFYGKEIIKPSYPTVDSDGYTSFQLWCFINLYGRYIDMGVQNVIEPLEIVFESAEKTAEWIKQKSGDELFPEEIVCSKCYHSNSHLDFDEHNNPIGKVFLESKYCPNCGAKMKGV